VRALVIQLGRFGAVGLVGLVIDVAVFNLLRVTILDPAQVEGGSLWAKVISTSLAILANWIGNRYWTFGATRRSQVAREGIEFGLVSVGGMLITLFCLWFSHHVLGFTSLLADNIAGNVVGLALGTAFRFAFYRFWVFHPSRSMPLRPAESPVHPAGAAPGDGVERVAAVDDRALGDELTER
jgi:putative flippase GtrA